MQFKIDATQQFTVITPERTILNTNLAANLAEKCLFLTQNGSVNFIIDLQNCSEVAADFLPAYIELYGQYVEQEQSFVLANIPELLLQQIKAEDLINSLNYAPSFQEAVDIVSMEIVERDLFREE